MRGFFQKLFGPPPPAWFLQKALPAAVRVRHFGSADFQSCVAIYQANAPGRFPPGVENEYRAALQKPQTGCLVAVRDGQIVGTGGMTQMQADCAMLFYGMVRPNLHGQGIGRVLLLCRLALLEPPQSGCRVWMYSVSGSLSFYQRFGFRASGHWTDGQGQAHPMGQLLATRELVEGIRAFLAAQGLVRPGAVHPPGTLQSPGPEAIPPRAPGDFCG